jgi:glucose/arabinose dehydrogenase
VSFLGRVCLHAALQRKFLVALASAASCGCQDELLLSSDDAGSEHDAQSDARDRAPFPEPNCAAASVPRVPLALVPVIEGLPEIVFAAQPPGDSQRFFVVTRGGFIRVFHSGAGTLAARSVLDLSRRVQTDYEESGALGLAFHPDYAQNRLFYLNYTELAKDGAGSGDTIVGEFRTSADDPELADAEPTRELLRIPQLGKTHKAGMLSFGLDGMLYLSIGDSGDGFKPQEGTDLKGKLLRIDVAAGSPSYRIPPGQPVVPGALPEIWSWGFRNPWRFSIDPCTSDIYVGDVGTSLEEELDVLRGGRGGENFGYPIREGNVCRVPAEGCEVPGGATEPIFSYGHLDGCAIIGGYVYRGQDIPSLRGTYLFADNCSGRFWALDSTQGGATVEPRELTADLNPEGIVDISTFAVDARGELYVASRKTNTLYRIVAEQ